MPPGDDKAAAAQAQAAGMPPGMPPGMPMPFFAPPGHFFANPMAMQASAMVERAPVTASWRMLPLCGIAQALASRLRPWKPLRCPLCPARSHPHVHRSIMTRCR